VPAFALSVRARRAAALGLLALCVLVVAWRHAGGGERSAAAPLRVAPLAGRPESGAPGGSAQGRARSSRALVVDVVGAVRRQGLVRVSQGARIADAIARAGGLTRRAARAGVNLAAPVVDGEQVVVPERGAGSAVATAGAGPTAPGAPVSLSTATAEQLDELPGVGPVTAQKIVDYRTQHGPFTSVDGLDAIPGIGPARLAQLQGLVVP
jgi:competence protein ComEA